MVMNSRKAAEVDVRSESISQNGKKRRKRSNRNSAKTEARLPSAVEDNYKQYNRILETTSAAHVRHHSIRLFVPDEDDYTGWNPITTKTLKQDLEGQTWVELFVPPRSASREFGIAIARWCDAGLFDQIQHLSFAADPSDYRRQGAVDAAVLENILRRLAKQLLSFKLRVLGIESKTVEDYARASIELSRCRFVKEFILEYCRRIDGFISVLRHMDSLEVIEIIYDKSDSAILDLSEEFSLYDDFGEALVYSQKQKSPLKAVCLENCSFSDSLWETMTGADSRIERLSMVGDCFLSSKKIQILGEQLETKNRNLRMLNICDDGSSIGIVETLYLLKALKTNDCLKSLRLNVNCNPVGHIPNSESWCFLTHKSSRAFTTQIANLAGLQILALDLIGLGTRNSSGITEEASLQYISDILQNGLATNKTLKRIDFNLYGFYSDVSLDQEACQNLHKWTRETFNNSLIQALSSSSTSSNERKDVINAPLGALCVLEEFRLNLNGLFPINANPTLKFLLSLNEGNLRRELHQRRDDVGFWRDAIVKHGSIDTTTDDSPSSLNPDIVFYLVRQNPRLFMQVCEDGKR